MAFIKKYCIVVSKRTVCDTPRVPRSIGFNIDLKFILNLEFVFAFCIGIGFGNGFGIHISHIGLASVGLLDSTTTTFYPNHKPYTVNFPNTFQSWSAPATSNINDWINDWNLSVLNSTIGF